MRLDALMAALLTLGTAASVASAQQPAAPSPRTPPYAQPAQPTPPYAQPAQPMALPGSSSAQPAAMTAPAGPGALPAAAPARSVTAPAAAPAGAQSPSGDAAPPRDPFSADWTGRPQALADAQREARAAASEAMKNCRRTAGADAERCMSATRRDNEAALHRAAHPPAAKRTTRSRGEAARRSGSQAQSTR